MRISRRHLQISLATLWLLDGALQCQPIMFTRDFARRVLTPAPHGQPAILAELVRALDALISTYPALANVGFASVQIALGLGLLTRRFARVALGASIAWALLVWVVGEGEGGVATGSTLLSGAPGAALLYAVIAVLAWPTRECARDEGPSWLAAPAWCGLWLTGAGLQLVAGNNSATALESMLRGASSNAPHWIVDIDRHLSNLPIPRWTTAGLIGIDVLVAIWGWLPGWPRYVSAVGGLLLALTGWFLFQGLGDLTSGRATDPNAGPLIALLALAVMSAEHPRVRDRPPCDTRTSSQRLSRPMVGSDE